MHKKEFFKLTVIGWFSPHSITRDSNSSSDAISLRLSSSATCIIYCKYFILIWLVFSTGGEQCRDSNRFSKIWTLKLKYSTLYIGHNLIQAIRKTRTPSPSYLRTNFMKSSWTFHKVRSHVRGRGRSGQKRISIAFIYFMRK